MDGRKRDEGGGREEDEELRRRREEKEKAGKEEEAVIRSGVIGFLASDVGYFRHLQVFNFSIA